jgi:hypothetical protein
MRQVALSAPKHAVDEKASAAANPSFLGFLNYRQCGNNLAQGDCTDGGRTKSFTSYGIFHAPHFTSLEP